MTGTKYCRACGSQIPDDSEYCPFCGSDLRMIIVPTKQEAGRLRYIAEHPRRIRAVLFSACIGIFIVGLLIGNGTSMDAQAASDILEPYRNVDLPLEAILVNNFLDTLLLSTPGIGLLLLSYSSYNLGVVFAALQIEALGQTSLSYLAELLANPLLWLEVSAFCLAASQGVMLLLGWLTKKMREEGRYTLIVWAVCSALLFTAEYLSRILLL